MQKIQKKQSGFTLIELVMVIVILGILAATALPKFVDLSTEANTAAVQGVAGSLASAASVNYAGCAALSNAITANKCVQVAKCSDVLALVNPTLTIGSGSSTTYKLTADSAAATNGSTNTCTIRKSGATPTAVYTVIGAGNAS